jgi:uncharacterized membrane protein
MARFLVACAVAWPILLTAATAARINHRAPWASTFTYLIAGQVCHQRPARSFHTDGVQWPVCGRCSGLYLAAPAGAIAALLAARRRTSRPSVAWLAAAAVPTAVSFAIEKAGIADVGNGLRFAAALPLGLALAWVVVRTASHPGASSKLTR